MVKIELDKPFTGDMITRQITFRHPLNMTHISRYVFNKIPSLVKIFDLNNVKIKIKGYEPLIIDLHIIDNFCYFTIYHEDKECPMILTKEDEIEFYY